MPVCVVNFCSVIHASDKHTITYELRNGWLVNANFVDLVNYSWTSLLKVVFWKSNTPCNEINLWYGNHPLFYAMPVLACIDEILWNLETTRVLEKWSLRPARVHDPWKCQVCSKKEVSRSCRKLANQNFRNHTYIRVPTLAIVQWRLHPA